MRQREAYSSTKQSRSVAFPGRRKSLPTMMQPTWKNEYKSAAEGSDVATKAGKAKRTPSSSESVRSASLFGLCDVLDDVLAFLDIQSLTRFDGCCQDARIKSRWAWWQHSRNISAVSFARAELDERYDPREQTILYERAAAFGHKMELWERQRFNNSETQATSRPDSAPQFTQYFSPSVFQEPDAFLFYVRLMNNTKCDDKPSSCSSESSASNHVIHWEGLVTALDQGAWGSSSILFFHLRELADSICWTPSMRKVLAYNHCENDLVENQEYQAIVMNAFQNFSLVMVAIPKEKPVFSCSPRLAVASRGIHFVSHDNRVYFHIPSRHYASPHRHATRDDHQEDESSTSSSSWVYPRLVTSEAINNQDGELFGIRVVCNQRGTSLIS